MSTKKMGLTSDQSKILCDFCMHGKTVIDEPFPGFRLSEAVECKNGLDTFRVGDIGGIGKQKCKGFRCIGYKDITSLKEGILNIVETSVEKKLLGKRINADRLINSLVSLIAEDENTKTELESIRERVLDDLTKPENEIKFG